MASVVVIGAGIGGLASAAMLAQAGHDVTVLERNDWIGGKSRRIERAGQRIDTGPALVTFPGVWDQFVSEYNALGQPASVSETDLRLERLPELGEYFYRGERTFLPVRSDHAWHNAWTRFAEANAGLGEPISRLLSTDPQSPRILSATTAVSARLGAHATTRGYVNAMTWMPPHLRDIIEIHTLNAGVAPRDTLALYAAMTAVLATDGIRVPEGGVNEIAQTLARLATRAGAQIRLGHRVTRIHRRRVSFHRVEGIDSPRAEASATHDADVIVSAVDAGVLRGLLTGKSVPWSKRSCSGVAIYAVLRKPLPEDLVTHSVVMPDDPDDLYSAIGAGRVPKQTMAFVNYYRPHHVYPNTKPTVAILLTAPADGQRYDLTTPWVRAEVDRISRVIGLESSIDELFEESVVLDPQYFGEWGGLGGALYGATHPFWRSGPFHLPTYRSVTRPWLWRVGASVHPGGGIPAVLGGALIAMRRLLRQLA